MIRRPPRLLSGALVLLNLLISLQTALSWTVPVGFSTGHRRLSLTTQRRTSVFPTSHTLLYSSTSDQQAPEQNDIDPELLKKYPVPRQIDESLLGEGDGRPGAIIETEEQLAVKEQIFSEIASGERTYPDTMMDEYFGETEEEEAEYDIDDPTALDAAALGTWTIQDLRSRFDYEWDPRSGERDPNLRELERSDTRYLSETPKDGDGIEVGYDPLFGPSNPMDERTVLGAKDSYMVNDATRDESMLTPQFTEDDPEVGFNENVVQFRKSLDILETYVDPFLQHDLELPRHVAKWHGYPEQVYFPPQNYTNNRFLEHTANPTDFSKLDPYRARQKAVELARAQNAEWLPVGVSQAHHQAQRAPYTNNDPNCLVGTIQPGFVDEELKAQIQPALQVLGSCVELLETIDGTIYRFLYHGLMKNKHGMKAWTELLLTENCGVNVTGVIFETGFRRRDAPYDGGDPYYGPRS